MTLYRHRCDVNHVASTLIGRHVRLGFDFFNNIPAGVGRPTNVVLTSVSSRRIDVSTTLFGRPTPAGMLLKKVKSPTAHDVLLTSMRRDLRRIDVDTTSFCHSYCFPCLSK